MIIVGSLNPFQYFPQPNAANKHFTAIHTLKRLQLYQEKSKKLKDSCVDFHSSLSSKIIKLRTDLTERQTTLSKQIALAEA